MAMWRNWVGLVIVAIVMVVHWEGTNCGAFLWDDDQILRTARNIAEGESSVLTAVGGNFMPITLLSLATDQAVTSGTLEGFHRTNIVLHALNCLLVFLLIIRLGPGKPIALLLALIFGCHPIQVETVAWIAERKNLLYALFFLLTALQFLAFLRSSSKVHYLISLLFFLLCILSKPQGVTLPLFLLGLGMLSKAEFKRCLVQLVPFLTIALAAGAFALITQHGAGYIQWDRGMNPLLKFLVVCSAFSAYLFRLLLPFDLAVFHPLPDHIGWWLLLTTALTFVLVITGVVLAIRGRNQFFWWLILYVATVLPIIHIIPFGAAHTADRYAYLPSVVLLAFLSVPISRLLDHHAKVGLVVFPLGFALLIGLCASTIQRTRLWCSPIELFTDAALVHPQSDIILFNIGSLHFTSERYKEAERAYRKALEAEPGSMEALLGLAQVAGEEGRSEEALAGFNRVIAIVEDHPTGRVALLARARTFIDLGRNNEATTDLERLVTLTPDDPKLWYFLGLANAGSGDHEQAIGSYRRSKQLGYREPALYLNLAISLGWREAFQEAIPVLQELLRMEPDSAQGNYLLCLSLERTGQDGCAALQRAMNLGHPRAREAVEFYCVTPGN